MLWSAQLGLQCPPCDVLTALVLNLNGNAITLSRALWESGVRTDAELRKLALERRARQPLTFGVVFPYSSHHLLLRSWLRSAQLDPDRDVRIVVVPPGQMFRNIAAHTIDGFCAGEPWNSLAIREAVGWCRLCSAIETPGHVEKVLMVRAEFATQRASEHAALVAALIQACAWCDEPQNRGPLAELLAEARFLNMPVRTLTPAFNGHFDFGYGNVQEVPDFHIFHRDGANVPSVAKAEALQAQLATSGLLPAGPLDPALPQRLFREDLHRTLSHQQTHHAFVATSELTSLRTS
jgi:ABC-type nitrate/sulfonate/bicarbonate transport system substrate-binding protein